MDIIEAKKQLMNTLLCAAQIGVRELYLFAVENRLFVIYGEGVTEPQLVVLEDAGAVYRALLGTMENRRILTQEIQMYQDWCLDFTVAGAPAHFDLTTTHMVVVRITSQPAVEAPRLPPPPLPNEDELVIDEGALAAAVEESLPPLPEDEVPIITEPIPSASPPVPVPEKKPEDRAMEMVGAIMLGTKPFPSEVVQFVSIVMTSRGGFVPLFFDGQNRLWVAMADPTQQSEVERMVGQEVAVCHVAYGNLQELLRCYRTDPRHNRH